MPGGTANHLEYNRRSLLIAGGLSFCGFDLRRLLAAAPGQDSPARKIAKSTIVIFLQGGASHIDTWDMKPNAPDQYREFSPIQTSAAGVLLCEHLPNLARQAHHLAIVNSVGDNGLAAGGHHGGHYHQLTGHPPDSTFVSLGSDRKPQRDDWPFIGSVVAAKRPRHPYLPQNIWLPQKAVESGYVRPGQFAGRLGVQYDPVFLDGNLQRPFEFRVPALSLESDMSVERLENRRELLQSLDGAQRRFEHAAAGLLSQQQETAFTLLCSRQTKTALEVMREPQSIRDKYGATVNGASLLMARRLVEASVPFVTVWWSDDLKAHDALKCLSAGNWDTHGNNFECLKERLLPDFDRALAALLDDLHQRSLLDETLVLVTSEMGRQPKIGDPRSGGARGAGRDHWHHCMSVLLAGGGTRGGRTYGSSDRRAEFPAEKPVAPEHIAKTVYYAMGIDDLSAVSADGRPYNLLDEGHPIVELF
ncbi:MAG TPA: DUF1501 domain-containing protein [Planctomycetaceae bacterium]|nr:DUF1501 domain-containing protein [Planctomycetaceae bacterium]